MMPACLAAAAVGEQGRRRRPTVAENAMSVVHGTALRPPRSLRTSTVGREYAGTHRSVSVAGVRPEPSEWAAVTVAAPLLATELLGIPSHTHRVRPRRSRRPAWRPIMIWRWQVLRAAAQRAGSTSAAIGDGFATGLAAAGALLATSLTTAGVPDASPETSGRCFGRRARRATSPGPIAVTSLITCEQTRP